MPHHECPQIDQLHTELVQTRQEEKGKHPPKTKDSQVWINAVQRLVCLGLATWMLLTTGNAWLFLLVLAAGFIDAQLARKILTGIPAAIVAIKASAPKD